VLDADSIEVGLVRGVDDVTVTVTFASPSE
jgi:hypothetical protein